MDIEQLKGSFWEIFQSPPILIKSPGRINLIGEHTDYNQGLVMPAAINKAIYVGISKRDDLMVHLYSRTYREHYRAHLADIEKCKMGWANYVLGVVDQLQRSENPVGGFNLYIDGDVPLGAGLSSSAALECAVAFALDHLFGLRLDRMDMARLAQKAEQTFAGVNCGIMDQFASVFSKSDHAILLDCRSMEYEHLPLDLGSYQLVLLNTNVKHSLGDSAYNQRRSQCEQGVAWVAERFGGVESLRDVDLTMLEQCVKPRDLEIYSRCRYVVEEIARTSRAAGYLKAGRIDALGELMFRTHHGLSKAYQVSCDELDFLVDSVSGRPEVLGARMMGGGFGGCTLNIVRTDSIQQLVEELSLRYSLEFGNSMSVHVVETGDGSSVIN